MSGIGQSEEGVASTSGMMETSMMEGEEYYNPGDTSTWTQKEMSEQLCRICSKPNQYLIPIFEGEGIEHQLESKIQKHLPIEVLETDELPLQVCYQCASTLIAWNDLVIACIEADKKLRQLFQHHEDQDDKGAEFFDEPILDSDEGEEPTHQSTSPATVISDSQTEILSTKRSPGKAKKSKLQTALLKSSTAGPSGHKPLSKKTVVSSQDDAVQEGTERYPAGDAENMPEYSKTPAQPPQRTVPFKIQEEICVINGLHFVTTSNGDEKARNNRCILCSAGNMTLSEWKEHIRMHALSGAPRNKMPSHLKVLSSGDKTSPGIINNAQKPLTRKKLVETDETKMKKQNNHLSIEKVNHLKFNKIEKGDYSFLCTVCSDSSVRQKDLLKHIHMTCIAGNSANACVGNVKPSVKSKHQLCIKPPRTDECYICHRIFNLSEGHKRNLKINQGSVKKICSKEVFTCHACIKRLNYHRKL